MCTYETRTEDALTEIAIKQTWTAQDWLDYVGPYVENTATHLRLWEAAEYMGLTWCCTDAFDVYSWLSIDAIEAKYAHMRVA